MKFRHLFPRVLPVITAFALAGLLGTAQSLAQNAYITNGSGPNTSVSVIATATNTVTATTALGAGPLAWQ
jgi:YVTN family beta-propeller protein